MEREERVLSDAAGKPEDEFLAVQRELPVGVQRVRVHDRQELGLVVAGGRCRNTLRHDVEQI